MRCTVSLLVFAMSASLFGQSSSFQLHGFLSLRGIRVKSEPSWTKHGFGRFDVGSTTPDTSHTTDLEVGQIGFDWTPTTWLLVHADGVARRESGGSAGKRVGVVQGYADLYNDRFRLRAGSFWLPTSRENVDPLWNSRYTLTYSALNTWIGQEVRPLGIDFQYSPSFYVTMGATAFRGNDTMGTVLAARGWTLGNRLSVYDEAIALPPPDQITRPVGHDLDGKAGFAERIRLSLPERALLQVTHVDNRASIRPSEPPNVPWQTRFNIVGLEAGSTSPTTVAAELSSGSTTLAYPGGTFRLDFQTAYLLVSRKYGPDRYTTRVERFSTRDHTHPAEDPSRENGRAVTVAWLHNFGPRVRAGLEYVKVSGDHPGAAFIGFDPHTGGSTLTVELRVAF